jgi:hypothetical protein
MSKQQDLAWQYVNNLKDKVKRADNLLGQLIALKNETGKLYITDSDEIQMVLQALGALVGETCETVSDVEDALKAGDEYGNLKSHDEKHILCGCLSLMWTMVDCFQDWLEAVSDCNGCISLSDMSDPNVGFTCPMSYSEIVNRLFLWSTGHSGGTSTSAKCKLLGVNGYDVVKFQFDFREDKNGE